jgi:hypothetical protein
MKKRLGCRDPYFRAGVLGFPFCCYKAIATHEPVFLLGLGFLRPFYFRGSTDFGVGGVVARSGSGGKMDRRREAALLVRLQQYRIQDHLGILRWINELLTTKSSSSRGATCIRMPVSLPTEESERNDSDSRSRPRISSTMLIVSSPRPLGMWSSGVPFEQIPQSL